MRNRCLGAGVALLLLASTSRGQVDQAAEKQKAANAQQKDAAKKDDSADPLAALMGPKIDKEAAERGRKIFVPTCGFCHGNDAHGKGGKSFPAWTYACRPPGAAHGPFRSDKGCILLEMHYYDPP